MTTLRPILQPVLQPVLRSVFDPPLRRGSSWSPAELFANGEQGGAWDFVTPSRLYQDAEGTLPVTSFGNPIGLAMDLSPNGNHLRQQTTAARPTFTADGALHDGVDDFLMAADANDWTFLHDGTGGYMAGSSMYLEGGGTGQSFFGTQTAAGQTLGVTTGLQGSALERTYSRLADGSATAPGTTSSPTGTFPLGVVGTQEFEVSDTGTRAWSNEALYRDSPFGEWVPSTDAPASPLATMTVHNGTSASRRRIIAISRVLTDPERAIVNAWLMEGVE